MPPPRAGWTPTTHNRETKRKERADSYRIRIPGNISKALKLPGGGGEPSKAERRGWKGVQ